MKQFFSARTMKKTGAASFLNSQKHETIENLINALDIVNKEATLGGIGRKESDSRKTFINGINTIRSAATNY